jgi:hypothetical protein
MEESLVQALRTRRPQIRERWEALLRVERANTALAHPDTLVHLLDWSLDEVLHALTMRTPTRRSSSPPHTNLRDDCECGRNPLLHFFIAGEQALLEAVVLVHAELPRLDPVARDRAVTELYLTLRALAHAEVVSFCALCQHRRDGSAQPSTALSQAC